ncbi:MAG TPA: serine hydrolase domain-containing protein [Candidatus Acidoferrum sp.]|jgi:CubicO group peptidase (beta-lactamase class C family)
MPQALSRRQFVAAGIKGAAVAAASNFMVCDSLAQGAATANSKYTPVFADLDKFVEQYMRAMNSPGLTLVLATREGVQRVTTYGFSDIETKVAVKPDELFQIGSITKSFVTNCLLQLRQEGKLDLHKPIVEYLPWFRIDSSFAPITTHHLLTHTSALPGIPSPFLSDPAAKHRAADPPGQFFHYNNTAFVVLGHLVWTLDGRALPEVIRKRVFEPLDMVHSEPAITLDMRPRTAKNYSAFQNDRPYTRFGRLAEAPAIVLTEGAGSIAATAGDMGLYLQMLANKGVGPRGALLSPESFELFSTAHIKAEEFGPTASYGYGIAVDTLDGHKILRHTGGAVSFMSAMHVDVDSGVGAFASINAMQGYRPNPVAQYAMQLMRAQDEKTTSPAAPKLQPATRVENASSYAGVFKSENGQQLEFAADGDALFLVHGGKHIPLEGGDDSFNSGPGEFERFSFMFSRADKKDPQSPVVEVGWGHDWFINEKYKGPRKFDYPQQWNDYVGHYRNENPWVGSMRIVVRKGKLLADGATPLEPGEGGIFHLRDEEHSPEWIQFGEAVNGKVMRLKFSGEDLWRVMAD